MNMRIIIMYSRRPSRFTRMASLSDLGDHRLEPFFRAHQQGLQNFFRGRVESAVVAADLTQETFLRMLRSAVQLNPSAYLYQVARTVLIDHYRARRRSPLVELASEDWGSIEAAAASPEEATLCEEEMQVLAAAIEALPARGREVFRLSRFEGLSYDQIAARLGISRNTVMVHLARALAFCRRRLREYRATGQGRGE